MMEDIGVIGLGNPLRKDDGIGIALLKHLEKKKIELPSDVKIIDGGTRGMNLLHIFSKFNTVILIDAINFNEKPGIFRFFNSKDIIHKNHLDIINSHNPDIFKIIELSKKIYNKPNKIYFFGVQPKDTSFGQSLTPEIEKVFDNLSLNLIKEINDLHKNLKNL